MENAMRFEKYAQGLTYLDEKYAQGLTYLCCNVNGRHPYASHEGKQRFKLTG
jgi:hypothetical protein